MPREERVVQSKMIEKGRAAVRNVLLVVVAALLGAVSLLVLVGAAVLVLGSAIPMWISAVVIGGVIGGAAYGLFRKASSSLRSVDLMPHKTFASLRNNRAWAKDEIDATRDQISATLDEVRRRLVPPT